MGWFYMIPYTSVLWVVFQGLVSRNPSNSVADPYLQMGWGGGGHPDPEMRGGGSQKNFFQASVWSKNKGEARAPQAPPWDTPLKLTVFELYFIVRNV